MKTLIIAFWIVDPGTRAETKAYRLSKEVTNLIQEEKHAYIVRFREGHFKKKGKKDVTSKIEFIKESIFSQSLFTKCQVMVLVISEELKKPFLKKIGYYKATRKKSEPAPAISGEIFGDDDKAFVYLQDKYALGINPNVCLTGRSRKGGYATLRAMSKFKFN